MLTPPDGKDDKRPHIIIIGAGIAGCSLAYELSKHTHAHPDKPRVSLIEQGRVHHQGASSVPLALLNPHRGRTARATPNDTQGLHIMQQLKQELESAQLPSGIVMTGIIRVASNARQAKDWQKRHPDVFTLTLPGTYHAPHGGLRIPAGGVINPAQLLTSLRATATQNGVTLHEHTRVTHVQQHTTTLSVHTSNQTRTHQHTATHLIYCIGATPPPQSSHPLPELEFLAGDVITLSPAQLPVPIAGAIYGAERNNNVFIGGNHRPANTQDPDAATQLHNSASWFVPTLKHAVVTDVWTGVRAKQMSNEPLVTQLSPNSWYFGALAGRGFLQGMLHARALSQRILSSL